MLSRIWLVLVAVAGIAATAADAQAPLRPGGLVMGVVVDSRTGKPVPSAMVTIGANRVLSDGEGRFVFADLAKGYYAIDASKAGFLDGAYGRQRPGGPSATLSLGADERIGTVRIPVFPLAAISGRVVDEAGEPLVGAEVHVLSKTWLGGRLVFRRGGSTVTDDRGAYRVGHLGPGEFVVAAIYESLPVLRPEGDFVYPVQYFPGAAAIDQAASVSLQVGDDRSGVDIPLRLSAAARVTGLLRSPAGPVAGPIVLTASGDGLGAGVGVELEAAETTSEPGGGFEFLSVPAGAYVARSIVRPTTVRAENSLAPTRLMWATTPVAVSGDDLRNVELLLRPGFRIAGQLVFESDARGRAPGSDVLRRLTGRIESLDHDMGTLGDAGTLSVDGAGFFTSRELPPGRYFIQFDGPPPGWTLKKIGVRGRDISNAPVSLDADTSGVTLTFTERPTELIGVVRNESGALEGATVLVFPRDRTAWTDFGPRPLGLRESRSSRDGSFRVVGLPPGDYFIVAVDDAAATNWQQAKRLETLAPAAAQVRLADGEKRAVDLRVAVIR